MQGGFLMLFTITQVKAITNLSTATIYRMFKSGELKKVKLGSSTRVELPTEWQEQYKDKIQALIV
mgnify:CR=1 FL=1